MLEGIQLDLPLSAESEAMRIYTPSRAVSTRVCKFYSIHSPRKIYLGLSAHVYSSRCYSESAFSGVTVSALFPDFR
jgi:hypothetical protein